MRLSDKMAKRKIHRVPEATASGKASAKTKSKQNEEAEVKLRVADRRALLRQLARLRASYLGRVHEINTLYDTPDGALRRQGKLLRIRVERPAERPGRRAKAPRARLGGHSALLTFKGPVERKESGESRSKGRYKIREEREVRVADEAVLVRILEALGLRPSFRYEKYRSTYRLPGLAGITLDLDETPSGDFIEAEGSRAAIDRSAAMLGYRPADYITKGYGQLFRDERRKMGRARGSKSGRLARTRSRDMLFRSRK